jgi:hypothetical protein
LIQEQFPPQLVRENGTKSVSRQQHNLAQVLEKRQQRRAQSAKEANHYGKVITDQWTVNVRHNFNGVVVAMQFIFEKTDLPILSP